MSESAAPPPLPGTDGIPFVAVSFDDTADVAGVTDAVAAGMDIAEVRLDRFASTDEGDIVGLLTPYRSVPSIATIRSASEGGGWEATEEERLALYQAVLGQVGTVDVEVGAAICSDVIDAAHSQGRSVIGSFHDFDGTPDRDALETTLDSADRLGVDIVKIATMVHSSDDVRTLSRFLLDHHDRGLIVIGMGETGSSTRVLFPFLGSRLTFAAAGRPSAPGQLPLATMTATFRALSPQYAARHPLRS